MATKVLHNLQNQISVLQLSLTEKEQLLAAKEQQISLLEEEVRRLRAAGKPAAKPLPEGVRNLLVLTTDPKTGKAVCAEHGSVSPNVRRQCPDCYCEAVKAAAGIKVAVVEAAA